MIRYSLICGHKHEFEAWFGSSADYDKQRARKLVTCPACDSNKIEKAIMAPSVGATRGGKRGKAASQKDAGIPAPAQQPDNLAMMSPQEQELRGKLAELREHIVKNSENVGGKFPEQARKMHYGEIENRSIYGQATPQEAVELRAEGVEVHPIPVLPEDRN